MQQFSTGEGPAAGPAVRQGVSQVSIVHDGVFGSHFGSPSTIHAWFREQALRTPHAAAVRFGGREVSFARLDADANRLARVLRERGVGVESRVAVCLERSVEMVTALLAVLKAGAAYVPLDPGYPADRLAYVLADAGAALLVTTTELAATLSVDADGALLLDRDAALIAAQADAPVADAVDAENVAYVIYTSGSTGRPKGVAVPHRALVNHMRWMLGRFPLTAGDRVLQKTPFMFDASVWEFWAPLLSGACLVMARPGGEKDGGYLVRALRDEGITVLQVVPTLLRVLAEEPALEEAAHLRLLFCGGEALPADVVRAVGRRLSAEVYNLYGPTECCIDATCHRADSSAEGAFVPLGGPISNTTLHVLSAALSPISGGEAGELFIGGAGVARGYLGRAAMTAERFVPDPFAAEAGARMYRTGDRVRRLADGGLDYLGRVDFQVKVRGFRIELGEIEAVLASHASIASAVVVVRDDRLVAYVVGDAVASDELRAHVKAALPEYMVPAAVVSLDAFPLTPNGKVNRDALPAPVIDIESRPYVAPRTATEQALCDIWAQVFGVAVGAEDDFFALGGHSLAAMQILARVRSQLNAEVPVHAFFEHTTLAGLAVLVDRAAGSPPPFPPILHAPRDQPLPLSMPQEQIWFLQKLHPHSLAYNYTAVVEFGGALNVGALQAALADVLRRHEGLRTTYPEVDGRPVQHIHPPFVPELPIVDLRHLTGAEQDAAAQARVYADARYVFSMTELPLVRWTLLRLADDRHALIHVEQHLVHDGWSYVLFLREILETFKAFSAGQPSPLPELAIQFVDFARWQRDWNRSPAAREQIDYWVKRLAGAPRVHELPLDRPRPPVQGFAGQTLRFELPRRLCDALRALARSESATLYMAMLAAFDVLMHRYTGQDDILTGSGVANRRTHETEQLIGMIVNVVVLRNDTSGQPTYRELLRRVRKTMLEAHAHQDVAFDRVVEAISPQRTLSFNPIYQAAFSFHDTPLPDTRIPGIDITLRDGQANGSCKFDLDIVCIPRAAHARHMSPGWEGGGATLCWSYDVALFERATMERMAAQYLRLLEAVIAAPETRIGELPLLDEAERAQVIDGWNATEQAVDAALAHERFAARAAISPRSMAVVDDAGSMDYDALNRRANRIAHRLMGMGVGAESRVAVCGPRSADLVAAILGVMKCGAAYVPVDPAYPADRIEYIITDAATPVVLAARSTADRLPSSANVLWMDDAFAGEREDDPAVGVDADNLAYVIYTSGSTGTPKGVEMSHGALRNLAAWHGQAFGIDGDDRTLLVAGVGFDASVWEMWGALAHGASLHAPADALRADPAALRGWMLERGITVAFLPTPLAEGVMALAWPADAPLRTLLTGGDALRSRPRADLPFRVINNYGPTENAVVSTSGMVDASGERLPAIGGPIGNTRSYVVDAALRPLPVGVPGELCVAGDGLARGYRGRPAMTAAAFVPDPFAATPGARMYRTGDRVRWLADGTLEFLGRMDQQVKVRGFRIELGEIESVLGRHPSVRECVVSVYEHDGDRRLAGYVVADGTATAADLRAHLAATLPEYMVPGAIVFIDALPVTANGKVNRAALPAPAAEDAENAYVAPRTEAERVMAGIWAGVLGIDRIGVHDDFFALGGHSMLATQILSRARAELAADAPLSAFFGNPTVARLAAVMVPISPQAAPPSGPDLSNPAALLEGIDDLSPEEVDALLSSLSAQ